MSPFAAAFEVPMDADIDGEQSRRQRLYATDGSFELFGYQTEDWAMFLAHLAFAVGLNVTLLGLMIWMFNTRWRVSQ